MDEPRRWGLTHHELETALAAVDPAALLVPPRILRRVIKHHWQLPEPVVRVPHRKSFVLARDKLLEVVSPIELGLAANATLPPQIVLLARLDSEELSGMTRDRALLRYWRLLYHARLHLELDQRFADGRLSCERVAERIESLGRAVFDDIAVVLKHEEYVLRTADDTSIYVEFLATFLELRCFAPRLVRDYFPAIDDLDRVERLLNLDVDAQRLFLSTRLPQCPLPGELATIEDDEHTLESRVDVQPLNPRKQSEKIYCRMMEYGDRARSRGNDVHSAMMRCRAALFIGPKLAKAARDAGRADVEHLALRLGQALDLPAADVTEWGECLAELLPQAIRGIWTAETRFLYDLQKVCLDHERGVYKLDVLRWALSRGQSPLRRPLPAQRDVLLAKHLLSATHRLPSMRLPAMPRDRLSSLLHTAARRVESRLRSNFRPRIESALDSVGLVPGNRPEIVARRKLVEELLDRLTEFGYLNMGNVRDAISRNQIKLRDVSGWREMLGGDQLLRVDQRLSESLEGVYRRGEVYLRWPQTLSSIAFGTPPGRFATRYLAIPFGGAYILLSFVQHMFHTPLSWALGEHAHIASLRSIIVVGLFLLGLYNAAFRRVVADACRSAGRGLHRLTIDLPRRIIQVPWVRRLLDNPLFRQWERFFFKPLVWSAVTVTPFAFFGSWAFDAGSFLALFLGYNALLNSRLGRSVDELLTDWVVRSWYQLRIRIFAAAVQWIIEAFQQLLEDVERLLYAVDEWLRFRGGEPRGAIIVKSILVSVWTVFNYGVRFCITLLVEPQINPIKHFPVVTVSHKVILPLGPFFVAQLAPVLGIAEANAVVWSTIWLIPGVFGFLVWELKENWRLYAANRPLNLQPALIGHHGETMVRLLRAGFHSGTIPKLFHRLRRVDRAALATGHWKKPRLYHDRLQQVEHDIQRFVERDLLALVDMSPAWQASPLRVVEVRLAITHVRVMLQNPAEPGELLQIVFQEKGNWLASRLIEPGWFERLGPEQSGAFRAALSGFYKYCGVELIHEQIENCLGSAASRYRIGDLGLIVRSDPHGDQEVTYDLRTNADRTPIIAPSAPCQLPTLDRHRLVFADTPIRWTTWIDTWQRVTRPWPSEAVNDYRGDRGPPLAAP